MPGFTFMDPKQHKTQVLLTSHQFGKHSLDLQAAHITKYMGPTCAITSKSWLPDHLEEALEWGFSPSPEETLLGFLGITGRFSSPQQAGCALLQDMKFSFGLLVSLTALFCCHYFLEESLCCIIS